MIKVDLHTHSVASPDGALTLADYKRLLEAGTLDVVAITDHNTIEFAQKAQKELGNSIIIGEEITTQQGEIIGLYLSSAVPAGLTITKAAQAVVDQGGLVYVPHPFEKIRSGVNAEALASIANSVSIVETYNGRAFGSRRAQQAQTWAEEHSVATAASSDSHGKHGWGRTGTLIAKTPTRATLVKLLASDSSSQQKQGVGFIGRFYPKLNRLCKRGDWHA